MLAEFLFQRSDFSLFSCQLGLQLSFFLIGFLALGICLFVRFESLNLLFIGTLAGNSDNAKQQSDSSNSNQHWHHQNAKCSASNNKQNANNNQGCSCWFFRFCYSIHMGADYRFKLRQRRRQAISFAFFSIQPRSDSLSSRLVLSDTPMLA